MTTDVGSAPVNADWLDAQNTDPSTNDNVGQFDRSDVVAHLRKQKNKQGQGIFDDNKLTNEEIEALAESLDMSEAELREILTGEEPSETDMDSDIEIKERKASQKLFEHFEGATPTNLTYGKQSDKHIFNQAIDFIKELFGVGGENKDQLIAKFEDMGHSRSEAVQMANQMMHFDVDGNGRLSDWEMQKAYESGYVEVYDAVDSDGNTFQSLRLTEEGEQRVEELEQEGEREGEREDDD